MSFSRNFKKEGDEEECDKETFLSQGKYELRHGDPERALYYLDRAAAGYQGHPILHTLRSEANCILGHYEGILYQNTKKCLKNWK